MFENLTPPSEGSPITMTASGLNVPDKPIIPFVEGDGLKRRILFQQLQCSLKYPAVLILVVRTAEHGSPL